MRLRDWDIQRRLRQLYILLNHPPGVYCLLLSDCLHSLQRHLVLYSQHHHRHLLMFSKLCLQRWDLRGRVPSHHLVFQWDALHALLHDMRNLLGWITDQLYFLLRSQYPYIQSMPVPSRAVHGFRLRLPAMQHYVPDLHQQFDHLPVVPLADAARRRNLQLLGWVVPPSWYPHLPTLRYQLC